MRYPIVLALVAGCPDRSVATLPPVQTGEVQKDIPVAADIDVLFVIDNSASTTDKQAVFAQNFPKFVQALDAFPTGRPNLHVGVIDSTVDIGTTAFGGNCPSPDPNDNGRFQNTAHGSAAPPNGYFITDVKTADGTRQVNYAGTLEDTFASIAQIGA